MKLFIISLLVLYISTGSALASLPSPEIQLMKSCEIWVVGSDNNYRKVLNLYKDNNDKDRFFMDIKLVKNSLRGEVYITRVPLIKITKKITPRSTVYTGVMQYFSGKTMDIEKVSIKISFSNTHITNRGSMKTKHKWRMKQYKLLHCVRT